MPRPTSSPINPWAKLDQLIKESDEPVGAEWFTLREFCNRYELPDRTALLKLSKLEKSNKLERWKGHCKSLGHVANKYRML